MQSFELNGEYIEIPNKETKLKFNKAEGEVVITDLIKNEEYEYDFKAINNVLYTFEITGDSVSKGMYKMKNDTLIFENGEMYLKVIQ